VNILCDTYIFYMDVYFLQNFLIKIVVLYLAIFCNKLHVLIIGKGIVKLIVAALIGTFFEIFGLFFGNSYNLLLMLVHLLEIPCMTYIVLGKERKQMGKVIIAGYFFVMVINGVLEVVWNCFGEYGNYICLLCVSCGVVYIGVRLYLNYNRMQKGIFPVEVFHGKKRIVTYGFYDSGNRLIDPYTQKGVHIISEQLWKKVGLDTENAVLVPYQALGNENGIVKVYYVEELIIGEEKNSCFNCPVGVTKENLFKEQKYEIILNEEVF